MRALILCLSLIVAPGCAAPPPASAPANAVINTDQGSIAGTWREERRRLALAVSHPFAPGRFTFVAQSGPVSSGGMLVSLGNDRYRIERYPHLSDKGGTGWQGGPAVAPFDGAEIALVRTGRKLRAEGGGNRLLLERIQGLDLYARIEQLYGRWHLSEGGRLLAGADAATLDLSPTRFALTGPCRSFESNGAVALADLAIAPGGNQDRQWRHPACTRMGRGDRLVEQIGVATFNYALRNGQIEARLGSERFVFVRG